MNLPFHIIGPVRYAVLRHGFTALAWGLTFAAAIVLAAYMSGCGPDPIVTIARVETPASKAELGRRTADAEHLSAEAAVTAADAEKAAADARAAAIEAENKVRLGKEAGKKSLADAADAVGIAGAALFAAGALGFVVGSFFGGIGRKTAIAAIAAAAGCIWLRFFIIVHGYFLSESISWIVLGAFGLAAVVLGFMLVRHLWLYVSNLPELHRAAGAGEPVYFGLNDFPIPPKWLGSVRTAWDYLRDPAPGDDMAEQHAKDVLARFGIPIPEAPAVLPLPAAGAGGAGAEVKS